MAKTKRTAPRGNSLEKLLSSLFNDVLGAYRPERHYMRGPGPKWREKHLAHTEEPAVTAGHPSEAVA